MDDEDETRELIEEELFRDKDVLDELDLPLFLLSLLDMMIEAKYFSCIKSDFTSRGTNTA
jgi:hypothetical protein